MGGFLFGCDRAFIFPCLCALLSGFGAGRPDSHLHFANRQSRSMIALCVGAEKAGEEIFLGVKECRVGDLEGARAVAREVVDLERVPPAQRGAG